MPHAENHSQVAFNSMKYCIQCGNKIAEVDEFCQGCGHAVDSFSSSPTISGKEKVGQQHKDKPLYQQELSPSFWWSFVIALGVLIAVVVLASLNTARQNAQKVQENAQRVQEATQQAQENADLAKKLDETTKRLDDLANKPPQTVIKEVPSGGDADYSAIVAEWQDRVARVDCLWKDSNGKLIQSAQGSALLVNITGIGTSVITNQHVVLDDFNGKKYVADGCVVGIFGKGARTVEFAEDNTPFVLGGNLDWAYIKLGSAYNAGAVRTFSDNGTFDETVSRHLNVCTNQVNIGDKLIVLGYPAIGTQGGVTVTEGIISGIEHEDYVTSAKIDHGNSGGAAILVKDDCYLGIPTWVANNGGFESLGRILKSSFVVGD